MRIAYFGRTELRCSVPVLLLPPAAVVLGRFDEALIVVASLAAHELAHAFIAHRLGCRILALELQPFGFIARLDRDGDTPSERCAVAAAGPVTSLLIALCSAGLASLSGLPGPSALSMLSTFNLTLGAVNLLPVLPLDGGRLALSFWERRGNGKQGAALLAGLGAAAGLLLACAGVLLLVFSPGKPGAGGFSLVLTGVFLVFAAFS